MFFDQARQLLRCFHRLAAAGVACAVSALAPAAAAAAADLLYATGTAPAAGSSASALYGVDAQTGANTLLWNLPGIEVHAGGLVYDASTDQLYATGVANSSVGTGRLFSIDRFTGATTAFASAGSLADIASGGLAIHPLTGELYATGWVRDGISPRQSTSLFKIDKTTGAASFIGVAGANCCVGDYGIMLNGLGFRSDGTLFATGWALAGPTYPDQRSSHLFTVDLNSGAATEVGASGVTVGQSLKHSGLVFDSAGNLLGMGSFDAGSAALYAVDPGTGLASSLFGGGANGSAPILFGVAGGLAFAPGTPVPEPASFAMLLSGLAVLAAAARLQRRRQQGR